MMPSSNTAAINSDVAIGLRMKIEEKPMASDHDGRSGRAGHQCLRPRPLPLDWAAALISVVVGGAGTSPGFMGVTLLPCLRRNWPAVTTSSPALRPCVTMMPVSPASPPVVTGCMMTYLAGLLLAGALLAARLRRRHLPLAAGAELSGAALAGRLSVTNHT